VHLLFDLDGTITDSAPGIVACLNQALTDVGRPCLSTDQLRGMIGTPLRVIFERVLDPAEPDVVARAVACYRAVFDTVGMSGNAMYPGIADALRELRRRGHRLQIVTAKPAVVGRRVVAHFAIADLFDAVHGPADDGHSEKADSVRAAIDFVGGDPGEVVMIGDRVDDVLAARAHSIRSIGVEWGYGSRDELIAAGASLTVATIDDLLDWVGES